MDAGGRLAPWLERVRDFRNEGFYERFPAKARWNAWRGSIANSRAPRALHRAVARESTTEQLAVNQNWNEGNMIRLKARSSLAAAFIVLFALQLVASDQALFDFGLAFDRDQLQPGDAQATLVTTNGMTALRIRTGHANPWPGVTLPAGEGSLGFVGVWVGGGDFE